jgi:hypothetical protein
MLGNHRICCLAANQPWIVLHAIVKAVMLVVLVLMGTAFAQNQFYVSPNGRDSNPGTQAQPWQTIQHAINSFSLGANGATIHVAAGTYSDLNNCSYSSVNICVTRGGSSPTVRLVLRCDAEWSVPSGSGCLLRGGNSSQGISIETNNVDVVGFDYGDLPNALAGITNLCPSTANPGPCTAGNSVHILHNYIHNIGQTADDGTGNVGCPGLERGVGISTSRHQGYSQTDVQIIGNRVTVFGDQAQKANGTCQFSHGIYVDTPGGVTENNVVEDVAANGVQIYSYPCNNVFTNNTVLRSGHNGLQIAGGDCGNTTPARPSGSNTLNNNILDDNGHYGMMIGTGSGGVCGASTPILVANNLMYGNGSGNYTGTSSCASPQNTLAENPGSTFVQYLGNSNDNLQLQASSAAVGAGTTQCVSGGTAHCVSTTDFDDLNRPSQPSIGAYEPASAPSVSKVPADLQATVE